MTVRPEWAPTPKRSNGGGNNNPEITQSHGDRLPPIIRDHQIPGRYATPQDIAEAVAFLCTLGAKFITGITLRVDGGINIVGALPGLGPTDGPL